MNKKIISIILFFSLLGVKGLFNENVYVKLLSSVPPNDLVGINKCYSISGWGNNLQHPEWGSGFYFFKRNFTAEFLDGLQSMPRQNINARVISNFLCKATGNRPNNHSNTDMGWVFGQFVDHDVAISPDGEERSDIPLVMNNGLVGGSIMFNRLPSVDPPFLPRNYWNMQTSFLDLSTVYGWEDSRARALRTFQGGRMKISSSFGFGDLPPLNFPFDGQNFLPNTVPGNPADSFVAGDPRCNELPPLIAIHTLFLREHNRLAREIEKAGARLGIQLSDQFIWELARYSNIMQYQKIVYNEWLPSVIGIFAPRLQDVRYNENIDPTTTLEFATVAMRFAHSSIGDIIEFVDKSLRPVITLPLPQCFFDPNIVKQLGIDLVLRWSCLAKHQKVDLEISDSLRENLFMGTMNLIDLIAIDIQRARDVGVPNYASIRFLLFGERIVDFSQITSNFDLQRKLASVYFNVQNVDPLIGMLAEDPIANSIVGKTLTLLLFKGFYNYANGDRCFHTNIPFPYSAIYEEGAGFTRLSEIIVANTMITRNEIPLNVFKN